MKTKAIQRLAAALAMAGALAAHPALAAPHSTSDVVLRQGDVFVGQLVGPRGEAIAGADVCVKHNGAQVARAKTNKDGVFAVRGVKTGAHLVEAGGVAASYRLWSPQTAPPSATSAGWMVVEKPVASGQVLGGLIGGVSTTTVIGSTAAVAGGVLLYTEVIDDDADLPPATP